MENASADGRLSALRWRSFLHQSLWESGRKPRRSVHSNRNVFWKCFLYPSNGNWKKIQNFYSTLVRLC